MLIFHWFQSKCSDGLGWHWRHGFTVLEISHVPVFRLVFSILVLSQRGSVQWKSGLLHSHFSVLGADNFVNSWSHLRGSFHWTEILFSTKYDKVIGIYCNIFHSNFYIYWCTWTYMNFRFGRMQQHKCFSHWDRLLVVLLQWPVTTNLQTTANGMQI